MAIIYNPNKKIFNLHTVHTTYQMQVDPLGYLLHLYYGDKTNSPMDYVLTYADRGFSGNPYAAGMDRTYSLDALPQEYPSLGTGDYRNIALNIKNAKGVEGVNLLYKSYEIRKGKYALQGLPSVYAGEEEAQTLEIVLADEQAQTGDVFRFTYSPRRMLGVIFWAKLFVVARLDPARRNRVDRDMPLGKR